MKIVLQTSMDRAKVFANNLGKFGIPLMEALTPKLPGKVNFEGQIFEMGSATLEDAFDPFEHGFSTPRVWAEGCLGWIWCQWLSSAPRENIQKEVELVVERGMEMQKKSPTVTSAGRAGSPLPAAERGETSTSLTCSRAARTE